MYRGGQLRDISEVSDVGVTIIQQFRHLRPFTHPLSSSPSVDHDLSYLECDENRQLRLQSVNFERVLDRLRSLTHLSWKYQQCLPYAGRTLSSIFSIPYVHRIFLQKSSSFTQIDLWW